jgi:hypothetical protein
MGHSGQLGHNCNGEPMKDRLLAAILTVAMAALLVWAVILLLWVGFFALANAEEQPVTNNACTGYVIGYGVLTADSTGDGFAVGNGLWLMPRPETPAEIRLREMSGQAVEIVIRVAK